MARHLLGCWPEVEARLRRAGKISLFLDFDGTLVQFRPRPDDVWLPTPTRRALQRLVRSPWVKIWVITGRRQADIRSRVRIPGLRFLGLYGWEGGGYRSLSEGGALCLSKARRMLALRLRPGSGIWVEDKGAAFAVHFRGVEQDFVDRAAAALNDVLETFPGSLRVINDEFSWAVVPRELQGKGHAARRQWQECQPGSLPIYLGDGLSDERAFATLADGVTVCVGPRRMTRARFRLRNPAEVCNFLERLEVAVR